MPEQASEFHGPIHEASKKVADEDPKTDVFILGCYFFYVLTGGKHLFGDFLFERRRNICNGQYFVYSNHPSWNPSDELVYIL